MPILTILNYIESYWRGFNSLLPTIDFSYFRCQNTYFWVGGGLTFFMPSFICKSKSHVNISSHWQEKVNIYIYELKIENVPLHLTISVPSYQGINNLFLAAWNCLAGKTLYPLSQSEAVRVHLIDSLIAWGYQGGDFAPFNSLGLPECILFAL